MNTLKIVVSDSDVFVSESENVIDTVVYVQIGDTVFPDNRWSDMTLSILSMWTENLIRHEGQVSSYILYFMDGPYYLEINQDINTLFVTGVSERQNRCIEFSFTCSRRDFLSELKNAFIALKAIINNVDYHCDANKKGDLGIINHYLSIIKTGDGDVSSQ